MFVILAELILGVAALISLAMLELATLAEGQLLGTLALVPASSLDSAAAQFSKAPGGLAGGFSVLPGWSLVATQQVRSSALVVGLGVCVGGLLLFLNHKREADQVLAGDASPRNVAFELRKYRRRAIISAMIVSVGLTLAALYWVTEQRVLAVFILLILGLLVGIFGLAVIDMFSVGLQRIGTPDKAAEKALVTEYLRQREKLDQAKLDQAKLDQAKLDQAKLDQAKLDQVKLEQAHDADRGEVVAGTPPSQDRD